MQLLHQFGRPLDNLRVSPQAACQMPLGGRACFFLSKLLLKAPQGAFFLCVSFIYRFCLHFLYLSCQALLPSPLATFILVLKVAVSLLLFICDRFLFLFYYI